jgi:2-methylaconitate cis-trans-isomerase PrpF
MQEPVHEPEQIGIPCQIVRGGTSKAIFLLDCHLPRPGLDRDALLLRLMGAPHLTRIDGVGGSTLLTSKIAIIGGPTVDDADVDYTFAQVEVDRGHIDYSANCGNISAAVAGFAIDTGLMEARAPITTVRIHNTNTGRILISHVNMADGRPKVNGDYRVAGVPGTGSEVFLDYRMAAGGATGRLLPTGRPSDVIVLEDRREVPVTVCDFGNLYVFVAAEALSLDGTELPGELNGDAKLRDRLREIRGKTGAMCGLTSDWRRIDEESPMLPLMALVAPPSAYSCLGSRQIQAGEIDIVARFFHMNQSHEAAPGTGSVSLAVASRVNGSVPARMLSESAALRTTLRIGHPEGVLDVVIESTSPSSGRAEEVEIARVGFGRTARKIMEGVVFVPAHECPPALVDLVAASRSQAGKTAAPTY